jgi:hypothetical protein
MSDEDPTEAKTPLPKPKEIPENKTAEKIVMEGRRMRGYLAAFKQRAETLESLEKLVRELIVQQPLGMVGVDAYERRLEQWRGRLTQAIAATNRARDELAQKTPP